VTLQIARYWVLRFNAEGPAGRSWTRPSALLSRKGRSWDAPIQGAAATSETGLQLIPRSAGLPLFPKVSPNPAPWPSLEGCSILKAGILAIGDVCTLAVHMKRRTT
jgi:hypothetical protein